MHDKFRRVGGQVLNIAQRRISKPLARGFDSREKTADESGVGLPQRVHRSLKPFGVERLEGPPD
jgi:hypothetical protein